MYKTTKLKLYEVFGKDFSPTLVFAIASIVAESVTLLVHFPYDLIKCRLQSKNHYFKYKNIPHAFSKTFKNDGITGLY